MKIMPVAAVLAALLHFTNAYADEPLTVALSTFIVDTASNELKPLLDGESVAPGDVVLYRADYTNSSDRPLINIGATLPVPPGTVLADNDALRSAAYASVDGVTFEPAPLLREATDADGNSILVPVAMEEIRALRWNVPVIPAGQTCELEMRVRVIDSN